MKHHYTKYLMTSFTLCADDYACRPAVSAAILNLLQAKRLTAVSCMVTMPGWASDSIKLKPFCGKVDLGLHLNLTEGQALTPDLSFTNKNNTFPGLKKLMLHSFLAKLVYHELVNELSAQLAEFQLKMGRLPDFIDGHQHIHQLPVVRDALLSMYKNYYASQQAYVRISSNGWRKDLLVSLKAVSINLTGARKLKALLDANAIPYNHCFSGIYNFSPHPAYPQRFKKFLTQLTNNGLLMCHPGLPSNDKTDPIAAARGREYAYFMSKEFLTDCKQAKQKLTRFVRP